MKYIHPILWRKDDLSRLSGIVSADGELVELEQGNTLGKLKVSSIEEFYNDLAQSEKYRISLGIPALNYIAFSFEAFGHNKIDQIIKLIEEGRKLGREVRAWCNEESAMLVVCFVTDDFSEDAGWDIYEWANIHQNCPSDGYGHASWYEYCFFGIPIYDTWDLENRKEHLLVVAPDKSKFAFFG
jgi:hypothetical protein